MFIFLFLTLCAIGGFAAEKPAPLTVQFLPRQPNWHPEIVEKYPAGQPKQVLLMRPTATSEREPVRQILYYEQGGVQSEADVAPDVVLHGPKVDYSPKGELVQVAQFDRGLLQGEL